MSVASAVLIPALVLAAHALDTLEPALRAAESAPSSPVLRVVRGTLQGPLVAEDLQDALPAARAIERAQRSIDAAVVEVACALPADATSTTRIELLVDQLLVAATVDAASGRPGPAIAAVSRAVDVARLLVRCDGASLSSLEVARAGIGRARTRVGAFLEAGWLDQRAATRAVSLLDPPSDGEVLRCAGPLAPPGELSALRTRLRADAAATRALATRVQAAPKVIEQGDRVGAPDVAVRCEPDPAHDRYLMSRPALAALRARGAEAILGDSQLLFSLDGSGLVLVAAGPGARSCGFRDGDVLVAVNGRGVGTPQDLLAAQQIVADDGSARFSVRRSGGITELMLHEKQR